MQQLVQEKADEANLLVNGRIPGVFRTRSLHALSPIQDTAEMLLIKGKHTFTEIVHGMGFASIFLRTNSWLGEDLEFY